MRRLQWYKRGAAYFFRVKSGWREVKSRRNSSPAQTAHIQTLTPYLWRVKGVFESARNKCGAAYTSAINVKNIKSNKILKEKYGVILGNVYFCIYKNLGNV